MPTNQTNQKPVKRETNSVIVSGFLKENTLEVITSSNGKKAIRGNLIIATGPIESYKIQFYVYETPRNAEEGTESKFYKMVSDLLPVNTMTLANYLSENPNATFEEASAAASKVWAAGNFDEYIRQGDDGEQISVIQIRGRRCGFKTVSGDKPFRPHATFEAKIFIQSIEPEMSEPIGDAVSEATGRLKLTGLIQNYDQSMTVVPFIVPAEDGVADYVSAHYGVGDTVYVEGSLANTIYKINAEPTVAKFGSASHAQYTTRFVNERLITGGDQDPLPVGNPDIISASAVKIGLAKREAKVQEAAARSASRPAAGARKVTNNGGTAGKTPFPAAPKAFSGLPGEDEVDF